MNFGEVLAHFKKNEDPEVLVALIEDPMLRRSIVAWPSVTVTFNSPESCREDIPDVAKWNWMWTQISFDKSKFAMVAALKGMDVEPVLTRLQGLRLIYPDGTINVMAKQYLRATVSAQLKKAAPKQAKPQAQAQE